MKFPIETKKKYQLKKRLTPIKKEISQLANPKLLMERKRKLLKNPQVGFGVFTSLASFVVLALLYLIKWVEIYSMLQTCKGIYLQTTNE